MLPGAKTSPPSLTALPLLSLPHLTGAMHTADSDASSKSIGIRAPIPIPASALQMLNSCFHVDRSTFSYAWS